MDQNINIIKSMWLEGLKPCEFCVIELLGKHQSNINDVH